MIDDEILAALDGEIIIQIFSVFIALCALLLTIWQGRQNYKHNKLSVKPHLRIMEHEESIEDGKVLIQKSLENCGLGSAIIKDFILLYNNQEVSRNNRATYEEFLNNKFKDMAVEFSIGHYIPNFAINVGESLPLLNLQFDPNNYNTDFLDKLNLIVHYQSIYQDETFTYDSREDRKFHGSNSL